MCDGAQEYELTAPELGGITFPDSDTVQPLGRPTTEVYTPLTVLTAVATPTVAVPSHGQPVLVA